MQKYGSPVWSIRVPPMIGAAIDNYLSECSCKPGMAEYSRATFLLESALEAIRRNRQGEEETAKKQSKARKPSAKRTK